MRRKLWWVVMAIACGPQSAGTVDSSDTTSVARTSGSSSTTSGTTSSTSTTDVSTTDVATTVGSTTDEGCNFCEGALVAPDTPVEEGYSGIDVVAFLTGISAPIVWNVDAPDTTLTVTIADPTDPVQVVHGPECCSPCIFLVVPCPGGLELTTEVSIATADGLLDEVDVDAHVWAQPDNGEFSPEEYGIVVSIPVEAVAGSLPDQTIDGAPVRIDSVLVSIRRRPTPDGWTTVVQIGSANLLGATPS